ncbi:hypothetical protein [Staphylococcus kloosii]|uniref:Uncharacterized protein n=1 Tax=Staphylococcus kloosii TaxID=29384 RepID=A0A151A6K9_9STAP|nr:hypothetical protein [Staphylococcus kloosii]KYH15059.1 hypothetical protein A0131_09785 [Staphylococcus kloosii]
MNIKELQKLDFLLKKVNEDSKSKNHKIVVTLNNKFHKVDFVPAIVNLNGTDERSVSYRNSELKEIEKYNEFKNIDLTDLDPWLDMFKNPSAFTKSDISLLVYRSNEFETYAYYESLIKAIDKKKFEFTNDLPSYIYNLESIDGKEQLSFLPIDNITSFEFVSIEPIS